MPIETASIQYPIPQQSSQLLQDRKTRSKWHPSSSKPTQPNSASTSMSTAWAILTSSFTCARFFVWKRGSINHDWIKTRSNSSYCGLKGMGVIQHVAIGTLPVKPNRSGFFQNSLSPYFRCAYKEWLLETSFPQRIYTSPRVISSAAPSAGTHDPFLHTWVFRIFVSIVYSLQPKI